MEHPASEIELRDSQARCLCHYASASTVADLFYIAWGLVIC
jgi:hypothetical protein